MTTKPQRRSADTTGWLDRNKGFVYVIIAAVLMIGVAWGTTQRQLIAVEVKGLENCKKIDAEVARSMGEDSDRGEQVGRIEEKVAGLEKRFDEVVTVVGKTNDKIDFLIQNRSRGNSGNKTAEN